MTVALTGGAALPWLPAPENIHPNLAFVSADISCVPHGREIQSFRPLPHEIISNSTGGRGK